MSIKDSNEYLEEKYKTDPQLKEEIEAEMLNEKELIKTWDKGIDWRNPPSPTARGIIEKNVLEAIRNAVSEREKEIVKGIMDQRISFVGKDLYLEGYHKAINNILKLMSKEILSKMGIALKGQKEGQV